MCANRVLTPVAVTTASPSPSTTNVPANSPSPVSNRVGSLSPVSIDVSSIRPSARERRAIGWDTITCLEHQHVTRYHAVGVDASTMALLDGR